MNYYLHKNKENGQRWIWDCDITSKPYQAPTEEYQFYNLTGCPQWVKSDTEDVQRTVDIYLSPYNRKRFKVISVLNQNDLFAELL